MSANWNLGWLNNGVTPPYNPDRWGSDPTVAGAAQQIGAGLAGGLYDTGNPFGNIPGGSNAITPPDVMYSQQNTGQSTANAIASGLPGWTSTVGPSDVKGRAAPGGLGGHLGAAQPDPSRNVGRNPDGSVVPVNTNPYGWGLAQGAGQAQAAPGVTPTAWSGMTGGHTGSTYNIVGFNPWTNLAQYNGGVYQTGGGDRGQANTPGGEDDINRVFRWTTDILKARGIAEGSPEAAQIFAANVERLKSEYAAAGANWATSKFAAFGAPGQQQQGQQGQPGPQGQGMTNPPPAGPGTSTVGPGGTVVPGQPAVTAQTTGTPGGTGVAQNPPNGQNGQNGSLQGTAGYYTLQHPMAAVQSFMTAHGLDPHVHSALGEFIQNLVGGLAPTLFANASSGVDANGNPQYASDQVGNGVDFLNKIFANGQGLGSNLNTFANNAMSGFTQAQLNAMDPAQLQSMIGNNQALRNFGNNTYLQNANKNILGQNFQDFYNQGATDLQNGQQTTGGLWDFMSKLLGAQAGGPAAVGAAPIRTNQNNPNY